MTPTTIITVPGLGGHPSAFKGYQELLNDFQVRNLELIDIPTMERDLETLIKQRPNSILLTNCYGALPVLRVLARAPQGSIFGIVIIEPFFAEWSWWRTPAFWINRGILAALKIPAQLGIKRSRLTKHIDYSYLSRYPLFMQPLFDMRHQHLKDYFTKINDILTFALPDTIPTKTLLIFSPHGYSERPQDRERIQDHFLHAQSVDTTANTHNIITISAPEIANFIRHWAHSSL